MNFTFLASARVLIHSSSGIFVSLHARSVFSSSLPHVPTTVSQGCLHRRRTAPITMDAEDEEETSACSLIAYPGWLEQLLDLFLLRERTLPCAAWPFPSCLWHVSLSRV